MRSALALVTRALIPLLVCVVALGGGPLRAQEDPRAVAVGLHSLAGKAFEAGQLDRALTYFQRALDLFQRLEDRKGTAATLSNIGLVYQSLGQDKRALEHYDRALALTPESDHAGVSRLLASLGGLAAKMGDAQAGIRYLTQAVEIEQARGDRRALASALDGLGIAYARARQFDRALKYQMDAVAVLQPTGDLREIARVMGNVGATGKGKGDYELATRYLTQSLELKRRFAGHAELASNLTNLALIYFDQSKLEPAAAAFAEAILHDEAVSREVREASKLGQYQDWFRSSLYRRYAHVLVNQGKLEEALTTLERGRSQGLARQAAQNRADYSRVLGAADARRLQAALAALTSAGEARRQTEGLEFVGDAGPASPQKQQVLNIRRRYDDLERQVAALREELGTRYPAYRRLSGAAPPTAADLKELAAKNPDTLYLQWAVGAESTSLLFALSQKDGIKSFVLEVAEATLTKHVAAWRKAIEDEDPRTEPAAARALHTSLFSAVEKAGLLAPGRYSRLVLVGDGPLLEVPFGALVSGDGARLVERLPVAVSGSFGVLTWPDDRQQPTASLLIAADPLSPGNPPLAAARLEGKALAALFPDARLLVGEAATRRQVLPELARHGILHFATHGLLDDEDGLRSGLLLATERGAEEDQLLEAGELINMRLTAQLAVLSACDTGQGQHSGGEGLLGLTWAFRAAGCPSVVASLWSVDDAATGQLMVQFYQGLKAGKRKDEALRDAMLAVKKGKAPPYFWAAFQVNGDTKVVKL